MGVVGMLHEYFDLQGRFHRNEGSGEMSFLVKYVQ